MRIGRTATKRSGIWLTVGRLSIDDLLCANRRCNSGAPSCYAKRKTLLRSGVVLLSQSHLGTLEVTIRCFVWSINGQNGILLSEPLTSQTAET